MRVLKMECEGGVCNILNDKVLQGDTFDILPKMPDESVELVLCDPPYNASRKEPTNFEIKNFKTIKEDWDFIEDLDGFNLKWIKESERLLKEGGVVYVTSSHHNLFSLRKAFDETELRFRNMLIWYKPYRMPTKFAYVGYYGFSCEYILFYTKGKIKTWNYEWMKSQNRGKQQTDLLVFNTVDCERYDHPCQKPIKLMRYLIQTCTKEGDVVLDPFAGSGTSLVAAKNLGRKYIGIEREEKYVAMINKRLGQSQLGEFVEDEPIQLGAFVEGATGDE